MSEEFLRQFNTEVIKNPELVKEIPDEEFLIESEKIYTDIIKYIKTVENFKKSEYGLEISRNADNIASIIDFLILPTKEDMISKTVEAYKQNNAEYNETDVANMVSKLHDRKVSDGEMGFKNLFPKIEGGKIDKDTMVVSVVGYLKSKGVDFSISTEGKVNFTLGNYPVELQRDYGAGGGIEMVNINEGRINILNEECELILRKYFAQLPHNSILIYPAIGDDVIFCNIANEYGHRVVGIDDNPDVKIPKESLITQNFDDYKNLISELRNRGVLKENDNVVLVFKGFDTLAEIPKEKVEKIIADFDGEEIALFGCGSSGIFGWGVPSVDGQANNALEDNQRFENSTGLYFGVDSQQSMEKLTKLSRKLKWTTGFFPGTQIRVYKNLESRQRKT